MPASRLEQLDLFRAAAVLMVVGLHLYGYVFLWRFHQANALWYGAGGLHGIAFWATYPLKYGDAGVNMFFVLSGFCIHLASMRAVQRSPQKRFDFQSFIWRRFWRIYPVYLLALGLFILIQFHDTRHVSLLDVAAHLLLIHNLFPSTILSLNPSFWSLGVEWQF